jgi:2-polyprenyl-3-methyl-5-hydroxy-6-metoxy-1,4-benzoquinol methylase
MDNVSKRSIFFDIAKSTQLNNFSPLAKQIDLNEMRPEGFHQNLETGLNKINDFVSSKSGWISVLSCPICGENSFNKWIEKCGNTIRRCKKCTHGYVSRRPKIISEAYENEKQITASFETYQEKRNYRIERFATERVDLLKKFKNKGKLLDFGCGTGWFLEYACNHYNVTGYEPTESLAKFTSDLLKIKIERNLSKFKNNSFDIITAFDVIEHVTEPRKTFQDYFRLLKKDGILLIYTPNANSIGFDYMKEHQNLVIPPLHLHYFNKKSIEELRSTPLDLIYFKTVGFDVGDIYAYERDNGNKEFAQFLYKNYQTLQTFFDHKGSANHLRAIFRKD